MMTETGRKIEGPSASPSKRGTNCSDFCTTGAHMLLNQAILALAPPHEARAIAPATFRELMACGAGVVWDGASERAIASIRLSNAHAAADSWLDKVAR